MNRFTEFYILSMFNKVKINNEFNSMDTEAVEVINSTADTYLCMFYDEIIAGLKSTADLKKTVFAVLQEHGKTFDDSRCYDYLYDAIYDTIY